MTDKLEGRELDAAIAERCFGIETVWKNGEALRFPKEWSESFLVPYYSTDMTAAWQVAEWIREQTGFFQLAWWRGLNRWQCEYRPGDADGDFFVQGVTAPEAICYAALRLAEQLEDI